VIKLLDFDTIVQDLVVDDAQREADFKRMTPPQRCYVILFTPRSGSGWLRTELTATRMLGRPMEALNPNFIKNTCAVTNCRVNHELLDMLKRRTKTKNGVFGIMVGHTEVKTVGVDAFFSAFDKTTVIFFLWRGNIIAQSVSLFRAVNTGRFHSTDAARKEAPAYDPVALKKWTRHMLAQENANLRLLAAKQRPARFIRYEDMMRNRASTLSQFADALHVNLRDRPRPPALAESQAKISDVWNHETEHLFRRNEPDFVAQIESERLILRQPGEDGWLSIADPAD
jgi:LPS sulfotransferase NodH